ncbi:hypothetical protein TIFTF001_042467 [Ficus carica]|uniref:Uncharacterized protein n=1 Tax=Ficus carica TaxID=3494 RepID=A0AA87ZQF9_FICCA|nr:hypothetical protein TIFTF001_042467 [Ficus carica]
MPCVMVYVKPSYDASYAKNDMLERKKEGNKLSGDKSPVLWPPSEVGLSYGKSKSIVARRKLVFSHEIIELGDGWWDGSCYIGAIFEAQQYEVWKVTDFWRDWSHKIAVHVFNLDRINAVNVVACNEGPAAAVGFQVPRDEDVGVVKGFLSIFLEYGSEMKFLW